jgi:drug/metabolite transporter (DMT)-like permease
MPPVARRGALHGSPAPLTRGGSLVAMRPDRVTLAAFVGFVLIAGAVSVAIRLGSFELPPFWAATLRYAMAVAIFTGLAVALHIPFPRGANLVGALLFSLTFVVSTALLYVGVSGSSASMGAVAFAVTPLVTLALAAVIGLERLTFRGVAGALVAAAGIVVVVSDQLGAAVPVPSLLALGGAMLFSAATAVVIKRVPPGHPVTANAVGGVFVLPILLALSALTHESWALPGRPETWVALVFLVVFGTVLLFPLALFIIGRWTASGYSYTGLFKPLAGVALAAVILAEPLRLTFVLGGALVIVGVWVGAFSAQSAPSPAPGVIEAEPHRAFGPGIAGGGGRDTAGRERSPQI